MLGFREYKIILEHLEIPEIKAVFKKKSKEMEAPEWLSWLSI